MLFILSLIFIGITLIQFVYYVFIFGTFSFAKKQNITPKRLPISIIICAKNEEENIKKSNRIKLLEIGFFEVREYPREFGGLGWILFKKLI